MKEENMVFAENFTNLLKEKGITQYCLHKNIGVSKSTVSTWCSGQKAPTMKNVDAICDFLNCSRSDLLERKDDLKGKLLKYANQLDNGKLQKLIAYAKELANECDCYTKYENDT